MKDVIKEALENIKIKTGLGLNFQVNFAIYKYLILDVKIPMWKIDDRPDPHYETINKMPDEAIELNKFCDGDSCEPSPYKEEWVKDMPILKTKLIKKGDKC